MASEETLPKLLYVADVPVENSFHGSAVTYRLLEHYPPERLHLVEVRFKSKNERRLPKVEYKFIPLAAQRLLTTRFHKVASSALQITGGCRVRSIRAACPAFIPQAILTVAHGYAWQAAARYAEGHNIPVHVIIHDNWSDTFEAPDFVKRILVGKFRDVYRQAASRLCVSPHMAAQYESDFGAPATVLYPARASSLKAYDSLSPRTIQPGRPFNVAYAGTIHGHGHIAALNAIAMALQPLGGELHIFGPTPPESLRANGLVAGNVRVRGVINVGELLQTLRRDVDALTLAVSFSESDLRRMELNFPSKLTDYTAVGVPIVIYGPPTCSAVEWARENPGVAAIVDSEDPAVLQETIGRMISDAEWRQKIAATAMQVGRRQFDSSVADRILRTALMGAHLSRPVPTGKS
jgi:glycosyltransferase involved in cell wall biosynthesis